MGKMGVRLLSRYKGGDLVEQYQVGKVYQFIPGVYVRYEGNGLYTGVENPNAAAEAQALKDKLGALYKQLYSGDKTVIPEIEKLSNTELTNKSAYDSYIGNQDQLDSMINAGFVNTPTGYKTKTQQAQVFADQAIAQAKIYAAELAKVGGDVSQVSAAGLTAKMGMLKSLKKEMSIIGGGYNDYNEESITMLANNLASGKYKPNSYEPKTQKQPNKALTPSWIPVAPTASTTQSTTKQAPLPTQKQYNPLSTKTQGYIATQKAPAATKPISTTTTSGYNPAVTKSRMSQAIQQPTYNKTDTTALKQKGWIIKKII